MTCRKVALTLHINRHHRRLHWYSNAPKPATEIASKSRVPNSLFCIT